MSRYEEINAVRYLALLKAEAGGLLILRDQTLEGLKKKLQAFPAEALIETWRGRRLVLLSDEEKKEIEG